MLKCFRRVMSFVIAIMVFSSCFSASIASDNDDVYSTPIIPGISLLNTDEGKEADPDVITVTFAIDNPVYTNDPGSGQTHITANSIISGGELTYTSWADIYKITGTGTVCSYTIPAGTTLRENSIELPVLNVENITNENTYSYESSVSWITSDGLICSADTAFTEDVTLYLSLFEAEDMHAIDFVCCAEHNASFRFYIGGSSVSFSLGQSIAENYIYTADEIMSCDLPEAYHDKTTFDGWKVYNSATQQYEEFHAGLPLTADYENPEMYGKTVKVYASWRIETASVTATFVNGSETVDTFSLNSLDPLGTLPTAAAPEGYVFLGWRDLSAGEDSAFVTEETIITQDTTYTAVFAEAIYITVVFHDILADSTEAGTGVERMLLAGSSLNDIQDEALSDGHMLKDCTWYTESGTEPVDFDTYVVIEDTDLYTYTYQCVLHYSPMAASMMMRSKSVEVTEGENGALTIIITMREGQPLSMSDFVINGVDYALYEWTYTDEDNQTQVLDIRDIVENGLSEDILATSDGTVVSGDITPASNHTVNFYAFIDGKRELIETRSITSYKIWDSTAWGGGSDRYYILAETLEHVYGSFGFKAADLSAGTRYFPNATKNEAKIWADSAVREMDNGHAYSALGLRLQEMDVYYLPKQTITDSNANWSTLQTTESFYSISVVDDDELIYATSEIPETKYILNGNDAVLTVSNTPRTPGQSVEWSCQGSQSGTIIEGIVNPDGTVSFAVASINEPYVITTGIVNNDKHIQYSMNLSRTPLDTEYEVPTIMGSDSYAEIIDGDTTSYTLLSPSIVSYFYYIDSDKHIGKATFQGWAINENFDDLLQPNTVIDLSDYPKNIAIEAQWLYNHANKTNKTGSMVNFYVSLNAHPVGVSAWSGSIEEAYFTDSVFTCDCGVNAGIVPTLELYSEYITVSGARQYFVLGGTEGTDINENHNTIVRDLSAGYTMTGNDDLDYTYRLSFPTDEQVLRRVRQLMRAGGANSHIIINGQEVPEEDMNVQNFTVRWYVFKYDVSDGWHVDGVLVSKDALLRVTKTFSGDAAAVEEVKNNFSITVSLDEGQANAAHNGSTLYLSDAEIVQTQGQSLYVWDIPVDQFFRYTVTENNYEYNTDLITTAAQYSIVNADGDNQNTVGWNTYISDGISVVGQTMFDGEHPLTVEFMNTYITPGTLMLKKIDSTTGNGLSGLMFEIKDIYDMPVYLFDVGNSHYEAVPSNGQYDEVTEIVTNANGQAFLTLTVGTYKLYEDVPEGYEDPGVITVTLGEVDGVACVTQASAGSPDVLSYENNTLTLSLRNHSETTNLLVEKHWAEGTNEKSVSLQLLRNGHHVGNPIILDGTTEDTPWTHVFENVPLFVDGAPAVYSLRETMIGDFLYSDEYANGYRYYDVIYSPMTYFDESGEPTDDPTEASFAVLTVTNELSDTDFSIMKVDELGNPLSGAGFRMYSVDVFDDSITSLPDGIAPFKTATSDILGKADFGIIYEGRYFVVEYQVPEGYYGADELFRLTIENGFASMERFDGTAWVRLPDCTIVNEHKKTDVEIKKLVKGEMGNRNRVFDFSVYCSEEILPSEEYTLSEDHKTAAFTLKHGESVILLGATVGSEITVSESNSETYTTVINGVNAADGEATLTVTEDLVITVENKKPFIPDMGVFVDSLPYILILAGVAAIAIVVLIRRKKRSRDDD